MHRSRLTSSQPDPSARPSTAAEDEGRPIHLLQASLPRIRTFVEDKLPASRMEVDKEDGAAPAAAVEGDVEMEGGDIVV